MFHRSIISLSMCTAILGALFAPNASASVTVMLQPVAASANVTNGVGTPTRTINQSGLSVGYASGVTNVDTYLAGNPTVNGGPAINVWYGNSLDTVVNDGSTSHGAVTFDMGAQYSMSQFILWNTGSSGEWIKDFDLLASNDAGFSSPVALGSFIASYSGPESAEGHLLFTFPSTTARYMRMNVRSGGPNFGGFGIGEAAFGGGSVPEPGALSLLGVGGLAIWRRRRA